jgi:serine/threonine protein kinase
VAGAADLLLLDRYRLIDRIGRGGMGSVWRGRDEYLGRSVAVKEIYLPDELDEPDRTERCSRVMREARAAARLRHPGVVSIHDVIEQDGRPWIIMELVESRSLEEIIRTDGPVSPQRAAKIGLQLLDALKTSHEAGVIHRDVKPSNVLIGDEERVVLSDFGIATYDGASTLTRSGTLLGSPAYMAPEVARGERATPASDLWSLGTTLYAAVEGRSPYERDTAIASLGALLTQDPESPRRAGQLRPVILGLVRKEPAKRLSERQTRSLLARALDDSPEQSALPLFGWTRRRPRLLIVLATCTAIIATAAITIFGEKESPQPSAGAPHGRISAGASNRPATLVLRAKGECKALVSALPAGEWIFNETLRPGQVRTFDEPRMNLVVWNGDACEVIINGKRQASGGGVRTYADITKTR